MDSLFGETIRKDIDYKHEFKNERWMKTENDERFEEYNKLESGSNIASIKNDEGTNEDETPSFNGTPSHLGAYILFNRKRKMNHFILNIDGNETNTVFDMDTDSIYTEKKPCVQLNSERSFGEELGQSNHDYGNVGTFQALSTAPKVKYCLMIFE